MATQEKPSWYEKEVKSIKPDAQRLLESYSGLEPDQVLPHVLTLRDKAFAIFPYPCIGQMRFLNLNLSRNPAYERVIARLRGDPDAKFLDAGCCVGQEIRFLADQGIRDTQLFGLDLERSFIDLGYELFKDRGRLNATFVTGDLTSSQGVYGSSEVQRLGETIDVVFASSLLHLWEYETQLKVSARLVRLCRDTPGVMVMGRQMGSTLAGSYDLKEYSQAAHYRHNVESLKGLWHDIGLETGTQWRVEAGLYVDEVNQKYVNVSWNDDNGRMIWWCATRV
ncbi:hypothetical protein BDV25DRAFT_169590 [Aspergillus avenaceus]|uniref:Methyltransferase domain-containing protein n=1 Tax=Aspergillus avenaceus TaxID=36643 RepID=A0A5N6U391_ASPAV|nr:hypothetical protein BDV25DRAFT_169590 [Aspergillus avenaceus]